MSIVAIYRFRGTFKLKPEHENVFPKVDASREGILFLLQETTARADAVALDKLPKYGVTQARILGFGPLQVELLQTDEYRSFNEQYARALRDGDALVYYPDSSLEQQRQVVYGEFVPSERTAP